MRRQPPLLTGGRPLRDKAPHLVDHPGQRLRQPRRERHRVLAGHGQQRLTDANRHRDMPLQPRLATLGPEPVRPQVTTGTIGTPASIAIRAAPDFIGIGVNACEIVASGKTPTSSPSCSAVTAAAKRGRTCAPVDGDVMHAAHQRARSTLVEYRSSPDEPHQPVRQCCIADEHEVEVADVVGGDDGAAGRRKCSAPSRLMRKSSARNRPRAVRMMARMAGRCWAFVDAIESVRAGAAQAVGRRRSRPGPAHEQVEVRAGLDDGEHLVERVELVELALAPRPGERAGDLERRRRARRRPRRGLVEPLPWWAISSSTRACTLSVTGPCAGSSRASGTAADQLQASQEVAERQLGAGTGSKPIDGVIVGSTWSPANSSPRRCRGRRRGRGCGPASARPRSVAVADRHRARRRRATRRAAPSGSTACGAPAPRQLRGEHRRGAGAPQPGACSGSVGGRSGS